MEHTTEHTPPHFRCSNESRRIGRLMGGLVIVATGGVLLARKMGVALPPWLFTWEMFLIVLGVFLIAKHAFRRIGGGLLLILIGGVFLLDDFFPGIALREYFWPMVIILAGVWFMLAPRRHHESRWRKKKMRRLRARLELGENTPDAETDNDSLLDIVTIFGGSKKVVIAKDFRGGEAVTIFGGTEIDLTKADMKGTVTLELVQIFGGTKLIVPPHWQVRSELAVVFGSVEDKRVPDTTGQPDSEKVLVLDGAVIMGGIDIKSY